ncbi:hypothetical protein [Mesorhizobium sp. B4-1-1]|uniref:hypothetical protein n=1 Tax=Mesorhizobium sp. B4-1-1 TaxID=2589890 RepID=UPI001127FA94|nr:hypothetical protein [Mesorhizobium sp. B4-1-1]TPI13880.1 hypothetical protein FJW10_25745 [Mesorhizobium sp. B4-1-1]
MVAYGSKEHPANLGPFRRIINVHWGSKYLALGIDVVVNIQIGQPLENFSIIGPPIVFPDAFHYAKAIDRSAALVGSAYVGDSAHWSPISPDQVVASGLPSSNSIGLSDWAWVGEDGAGTKIPFHQWHAGGAAVGVPAVEAPGGAGTFNQDLAPSVDYRGQLFLEGAPNWTPFFTNAGQWGTGATDGGPFTPLISDIESEPFSLAGLSATYKDKTWRPLASLVSGVSGFAHGSLLVLLKKEDVTA